MGVSKEYRNELVQNIIGHLKRLGLSEKTIGFFMRAYHVNVPIYFFIIMVYGTFAMNVALIAFLLCALASFIAFDGCILSRIESELDHDDITVVDPMLELAGIEKTHKNRIHISYLIAGMYLVMSFLIFWFRFKEDVVGVNNVIVGDIVVNNIVNNVNNVNDIGVPKASE